MMTQSLKGKILVFVVFLSGIASGVLLSNFYEMRLNGNPVIRRPEGGRGALDRSKRDFDAMSQYLGLNDTQRQQVRGILDEMRTEFQQLQKQTEPQFREISDKSRARIDAILTDEQRRKMDQFRHDHEPQRGPRSGNK
jgi:hypothetical protein